MSAANNAVGSDSTKSVALEVAKSGIRVTAVGAGSYGHGHVDRFTGTPEHKAALVTGVLMGRPWPPRKSFANAIAFIASDEASVITGHILHVDGGHTFN